MPNYNNLTIIGHAGRDAEVRVTQKGDPVASFSVAVKDYQDKTTWFDVSVFGKQAENYVGKYLKKGLAVMVSGPVTMNEYTNKGGENKVSLRITARDVQILTRSDDKNEKQDFNAPVSDAKSNSFDDTIPF